MCGYVNCMWTVCELYVTVCELYVNCMWTVCDLYVICMWFVCDLYVMCMWCVCELYVMCMWTVCELYVMCMWTVWFVWFVCGYVFVCVVWQFVFVHLYIIDVYNRPTVLPVNASKRRYYRRQTQSCILVHRTHRLKFKYTPRMFIRLLNLPKFLNFYFSHMKYIWKCIIYNLNITISTCSPSIINFTISIVSLLHTLLLYLLSLYSILYYIYCLSTPYFTISIVSLLHTLLFAAAFTSSTHLTHAKPRQLLAVPRPAYDSERDTRQH